MRAKAERARAGASADKAAAAAQPDGPGSLLGISVRGGRARRFPDAHAQEPAAAPRQSGAAAPAAPGVVEPVQGGTAPAPVAGLRHARLRPPPAFQAVAAETPAPAMPAGLAERPAPLAGALLAQWRGWRNGGRLPALAKVEGRMAALCPGGVLLAVSGGRVEVAKRLPGEAPEVDLAALEWMRSLARHAARQGLPRHEMDEEAGLGLVVLPFSLAAGDAEATAVLCRLYPLEVPARPGPQAPGAAEGGFFSGVLRKLTGT